MFKTRTDTVVIYPALCVVNLIVRLISIFSLANHYNLSPIDIALFTRLIKNCKIDMIFNCKQQVY